MHLSLTLLDVLVGNFRAHYEACQKTVNKATNPQHLTYMCRLYSNLLVRVTLVLQM